MRADDGDRCSFSPNIYPVHVLYSLLLISLPVNSLWLMNATMALSNGVKPSPFTIDNIPFGVISTSENPAPRCASAYEGKAIDLSVLEKDGFFLAVAGFEGAIFASV